MDFLTHALVGFGIRRINKVQTGLLTFFSVLGATLPDVGEIIIQNALSKKYGEGLSVYDTRTSDSDIASQIEITGLYDVTHSLITTFVLIVVGYIILKYTKNEKLYFSALCILWTGFGQFSHVCLDSFTHGKVWALKLFYPISNQRFRILSESVGNWWEWQPNITIPYCGFTLPIYCLFIWLSLICWIFYTKKHL